MLLIELVSYAEVSALENHLDALFDTLGIDVKFTQHFIERLLGREVKVTVQEIENAFLKLKNKYKQRLLSAKKQGNYSAVLQDLDNELNIVFSISSPKKPGEEAVMSNITMMQKDPKRFVTNAQGGDKLVVGSPKRGA